MADKIRYLKQQTNAIFSQGVGVEQNSVLIEAAAMVLNFIGATVTPNPTDPSKVDIVITGGGTGNTNIDIILAEMAAQFTSSSGTGATLTIPTTDGMNEYAGVIDYATYRKAVNSISEVISSSDFTGAGTNSDPLTLAKAYLESIDIQVTYEVDHAVISYTGGKTERIEIATSTEAGLAAANTNELAQGSVQGIEADTPNVTITPKYDGVFGISVVNTGGESSLPFKTEETGGTSITIPKARFGVDNAVVSKYVSTINGDQTFTIEPTDDSLYIVGTGILIRKSGTGTNTITTTDPAINYRDPRDGVLYQMSSRPLVFDGDIDFYFTRVSGIAEEVRIGASDTTAGPEYGVALYPNPSGSREILVQNSENAVEIAQRIDFNLDRFNSTLLPELIWSIPVEMYDQDGLSALPTSAQVYVTPSDASYTPPSPYVSTISRDVSGSGVDFIAVKSAPDTPDFAKHLQGIDRLKAVQLGRLLLSPAAAEVFDVFSSAWNVENGDFEEEVLAKPRADEMGGLTTDGSLINRSAGTLYDTKNNEQIFADALVDNGVLWIEQDIIGYQRVTIPTGLDADTLKFFANTNTGSLTPISGNQIVVHSLHLDEYDNAAVVSGGFVMATSAFSNYDALVAADLFVDRGPFGYNYQNDMAIYTETFPSALIIVDTTGIIGIIDVRPSPYSAFKAQDTGVVDLTKSIDATANTITLGTSTGGDEVVIDPATDTSPGLFPKEDKAKLDSINPNEAKPWGVHEVNGADSSDDLNLVMVLNNGIDYILKPQNIQQITVEDVAFPKGAKILMSKEGAIQARILGGGTHTFNGDTFFDMPDDGVVLLQQTADTGKTWRYQVNPTVADIARWDAYGDDINNITPQRIVISTARMQDGSTYNATLRATTVTLTKAELDGFRLVEVSIEATPDETDDGTPQPIDYVIFTTESSIASYVQVRYSFDDVNSLVPARPITNSYPLGQSNEYELREIGDYLDIVKAKVFAGDQWRVLGGRAYPIDDKGLYYAESIEWKSGGKMLDDTLQDHEDRITNNRTDINELINNPAIPERIVNADGAVSVLDNGALASVSQGGFATLTANGTHSSAPIAGTYAKTGVTINSKAFDDATVYAANLNLQPYNASPTNVSMREQLVTSPADAVGVITTRCNAINGVVQARTNGNIAGNVFQGVSGGNESFTYDITGLKNSSCVVFIDLKVANNAGVGQVRTGKVVVTHDGVSAEFPFSAGFDAVDGFTDVNLQVPIPDGSAVTTATVQIVNDAGQVGVLWTDIAINVQQFFGTEITQRTNVAIDRQFTDRAAWVDSRVPANVDTSTFPVDSVMLDNLGKYRQREMLGSIEIQQYLAEGYHAAFINLVAGVNTYRVGQGLKAETGTPSISSKDGFIVYTRDGSHSANAEYNWGFRSRLNDGGGNQNARSMVPGFSFKRKGAFSWQTGGVNDDPLRGFSIVTDGDSSNNGDFWIDLELWQDSGNSAAIILWKPNSLTEMRPLSTDDIVVNPDNSGLRVKSYVTQGLQSRDDDTSAAQYDRATGNINFITSALPLSNTADNTISYFETTANQQPTGLGDSGKIMINFGAGGVTSDGAFSVASNGMVTTILDVDQISIDLTFRLGRSGGAGEAEIVGWLMYSPDGVEANAVQVGETFTTMIDDQKSIWTERIKVSNKFVLGSKFWFNLARDENGNNSGGLMTVQPTGTLSGLNPSPSAAIRFYNTSLQFINAMP